MTNFIPLFPLSVVVFPGEELNLHIFEPQYIQLVQECNEQKKGFGIPVVLNKEVKELGTLMTIKKVAKVYESGEMDIVTAGQDVFRILETIHSIPNKLYKGAIVNYPANVDNGRKHLMKKVLTSTRLLHQMLNIKKDFKKEDHNLNSYDLAHHVGLSIEQEYEFLGLMDELHRQEFLKRHLHKTIPVISEMQNLKEKIKMNGHFRSLT